MGRRRVDDLLQVYSFWITDVEPSLQPPHFVFDTTLGFQSITAPEILIDVEEIVEGTSSWKRKLIGKASASSITLTRGARFWDGDFWKWIEDTLEGKKAPRKNLVLYHFMNASLATAGSGISIGPHDLGLVVARAWVLIDAIPSRYKAGSDFDAASSDVSIQELDIECERIYQLDLAKG